MVNTIKKRADFLAITATGKKFITGTFILQAAQLKKDNTDNPPRFGFTVTKKMGNAVTRNRIRRRLREAVRLSGIRHSQDGYDYVLIPRHKAKDCPFSDLLRDMDFAFSRIIYMKDNTPTATKQPS
jgi:ribonuclease P protein component